MRVGAVGGDQVHRHVVDALSYNNSERRILTVYKKVILKMREVVHDSHTAGHFYARQLGNYGWGEGGGQCWLSSYLKLVHMIL